MLDVIHLLIPGLTGIYTAFHLYARATSPKQSKVSNPNFNVFQRSYLIPYLLATLADWFQAPYLYKLYHYYGFLEQQIAVIYVVGFISTVIASTLASTLVHKAKRKQFVLVLTTVNIVSCLTKLSWNYHVLLVGRILAGFSITLLFSFYQEWYVYQHNDFHGFPEEWIELTFNKAAFWNGVLAVACGLVSHFFADTLALTPVAPFMLAIPLLILSACIIVTNWDENCGNPSIKFRTLCVEGLKDILLNKSIMLLAIVQSLFEGALYLYVFLWTPVLDGPGKPIGMIFALFMLCIIIGSPLQVIMTTKLKVSTATVPIVVCLLGLCSSLCLTYATHPATQSWNLSLFGILLFELACGIHIPSINKLQSVVFKDNTVGVVNWVRVPVNVIACACLMSLHGSSDNMGTHKLFMICSGLLLVAVFVASVLRCVVGSDTGNGNTPGLSRSSSYSGNITA
ncbi:molybdate-anion transporter-like [Symsagittifera roscoffensis]|uniref:molybdate-anion transporter-like n=1 Tax=Symsagittifera roscoffensis TaxID=84072 RepID=UPI00307C1BDE